MTSPRRAACSARRSRPVRIATLPLCALLTLASLRPGTLHAQGDAPLVQRSSVTISSNLTRHDLENVGTQTVFELLTQRIDYNYRPNANWELKFPFRVEITDVEDADTFTDLEIGLLPSYVFTSEERRSLTPYVALGPLLNYQNDGDESVFRIAGEARFGLRVPLTQKLEFDPWLFFQYYPEKEDDNLPEEKNLGLALGLRYNWSAGSETSSEQRADFNLSKGYGQSLIDGEDDAPRIIDFSLPQDYLGLYWGVGETGQIRLGGEVSVNFERGDFGDFSYFAASPTLQWYFNPSFRTEGGFFAGVRGNIAYYSADNGNQYDENSATQFGVGGEVQYVWPWRSNFTWNVGLAYDRLFETDEIQGQGIFRIRAGMSYFLRSR